MVTELILALATVIFGGTSVVSIIKFLKYKHQNDRMMEAQAAQSEEETKAKAIQNDKDQIDLGTMYITKVKELSDMIAENSKQSSEKIMSGLSTLEEKVTTVTNDVTSMKQNVDMIPDIVEYLNGDFSKFLNKKHGITRKPKTKKNDKDLDKTKGAA